jgi:hypothetical protein
LRYIPASIIYLTGFVSTICILFCGIYFSSNKTIGIWTLFGSIVFGLLTGFLYWQNDIWKTQASIAENIKKQASPTKETNRQNGESKNKKFKTGKSKHDTPPQQVNIPDKSDQSRQPQKQPELVVGKDSVVMGNIPPNTRVGDGSVVIGPTDNRGNTIINTPMAVGHGAKAGPGSIAIGANAGAGLKQGAPTETKPPK